MTTEDTHQISTSVEGIGHLLSDRLLAIPDYQRSYSWTSEEVRELWEDLVKAMALATGEYFLGSIVTTTTSAARYQVIDGQQRLATISMLFAAMVEQLRAKADERGDEISSEMLGKKNMKTRELEQRLTLNAEDNDVFRQIVTGNRSTVKVSADSHNKLLAAYDYLAEKIAALETPGTTWADAVIDLHDYILTQAKIIGVHVNNENRAFVIFETLNDRGLNLSTGDLLKNHLFGTAGGRLEEVKNSWAHASTPFNGREGAGDIDTFLRHYWASSRGVTRIKALFSEIRTEIDTEQAAVDLAQELAGSSTLWASMFDRDADFWKAYSIKSRAAIETLSSLKVEQCRPLLLAAMRKLSQPEVSSLLAMLVSWNIRWFVVGGGSAGVTERLYATSALKITNGGISSAAEVAKEFQNFVPTDGAFETNFSTHTVRRGWLARYYLVALEGTRRGEEQPELVPNTDQSEVNLEHVLPRNPKPHDWPAFTSQQVADYRLMLGNQVLLREADNTQLGNRPFSVKKPMLETSKLALTKEVGDEADWTPAAIEQRQIQLAKLAITTWPR